MHSARHKAALAILIGAPRHGAAPAKQAAPHENGALHSASEDLIDAVKGGDPKAVADALHAAYTACSSAEEDAEG